MSFALNFKAEGFKQARNVFRRLMKADIDRRPLTDAMGQTLVESAVHRLAVTNVDPEGKDWVKSERAKEDGGKTQFKTGMAGLAGSLLHVPDDEGFDYGSPLVYAAQRQFGGTIVPKNPDGFLAFPGSGGATVYAKSVTQPARAYLGVSDDDATELGALALEYYADAMGMPN